MAKEKVIRIMIEGGNASPGPPLGPTLSQLKLNVAEVVKAINEATKEYAGLTVPVEIIIDTATKKYQIKIGIPTTTALLLKEAGVTEPSGDPMHKKIGDISLDKVIKIAILKKESLNTKTLKSAVKIILGSARSIGLTINGKDPKIVRKEIDEGLYDDLLSKYESEWRGK